MRTRRPVRVAARWLAAAVCALAAVVSASVPVRLALAPPAGARPDAVLDARTLAHLRHLTAALDGGAAERMHGLFPEGFVFTNALVGLSWARVAAMDVPDAVQAEALDGARRASAALESAAGRAPFPAVQSPRYGAFHAGWSAYLLGQTLAATPPEQRAPADVRRFRAMCRHLDAAFDASPFPLRAGTVAV